jgi:hypothetical protein
VVYAIKSALKRKLYNIDHRIILATGKERVVNSQSEFIFYEIKFPIRMGATVLGY